MTQPLLTQLLEQLPDHAWTADQRLRWCRAFQACIDLLITVTDEPAEPAATSYELDVPEPARPASAPTGDEDDDPIARLKAAAVVETTPEGEYPCPDCGAVCATRNGLAGHRAMHVPASCWCGWEGNERRASAHRAAHRRRGETAPAEAADAQPTPVATVVRPEGWQDEARRRAAEAI